MYLLKTAADNDLSPEKADLGVGIYRNESGLYSELEAVAKVPSIQFSVEIKVRKADSYS